MAASSPKEPAKVPATARRPAVKLLAYQKADVESEDRFRWNNWSRQTGKSFTKSLRRILRGIQRGRDQLFLSASEQQSKELMLKAAQHLQAMQIATRSTEVTYFEGTSIRQMEIVIPDGIRIIGLPANPRTARGFTGDVFLDEFAMHADDRGIWAGIFPSIMRGRGELDVASTPKGKKNMFYQLMLNGAFGHQTVTIQDAVADGLEVDIAELRAGMSDDEMWRQEFDCEFLDEATAFLTYDLIAACESIDQARADPDWKDLEAFKGDLYVGMDIGRLHDLTVFWLLKRDGDRLVTVGVIEQAQQRFSSQLETLSRILSLPSMRRCCIDSTGIGLPIAEAAFDSAGHVVEGVTFTLAVKQDLAGGLRIRVEERSIVIPASETIRNDWHSITKLVTSSGNVRYLAERTKDGHADRFWAAALAVHAAGGETGPVEAFSSGPLRFGGSGGAL